MITYRPDHIHILATDVVEVAKWYRDKLGTACMVSSLGLDHFGPAVDDVDAAVADLESKGVKITFRPQTIRPGCRAAYIAAPDGVSIELVDRDHSIDFLPAGTSQMV